jgi:hypothetical protein
MRLSGVQEAGGSVVPRCSSVLNRRWGGRGLGEAERMDNNADQFLGCDLRVMVTV